ncbi:Unannotated [Lentimonas sp. CC19]|nr:Unannotated [Lentimonas sp. CC19]CAA6693310.1 Unannotated [Lentimonas sp. CC10]CAA7071790.1 Unannotated [Lentimonas sp. CC11]
MLFLILLPSQGEVARSAEMEGFSLSLTANVLKLAQNRPKTLPSRFAIHLPFAAVFVLSELRRAKGKELLYHSPHTFSTCG